CASWCGKTRRHANRPGRELLARPGRKFVRSPPLVRLSRKHDTLFSEVGSCCRITSLYFSISYVFFFNMIPRSHMCIPTSDQSPVTGIGLEGINQISFTPMRFFA